MIKTLFQGVLVFIITVWFAALVCTGVYLMGDTQRTRQEEEIGSRQGSFKNSCWVFQQVDGICHKAKKHHQRKS